MYQEQKFLRFNRSRSNREIRRREKASLKRRSQRNHARTVDGYAFCPAPEVFSLVENTNEVLEYFRTVGGNFRSRRKVYFDFSAVRRVTPETIAFLVAHIKDNRFTKLVHYRGNNPDDPTCAKVFDESGFFQWVRSDVPRKAGSGAGTFFHEITKNKVEPTIAKEISKVAIEFSLQNKGIFSPLYEVLVECMANTNNHANPMEQGMHNWWSFCYCDEETKISHFCFIDLGVGILRSLPVKKYRLAFNLISVGDSAIFEDIIDGKVKSRTGEPDRGKGIPAIYQHAQHDFFKEFSILTNRTVANLKTGRIEQIRAEFNGTLLYWELYQPEPVLLDSDESKQLELAL